MKNKLIALLLSFTFIFTLIPLNALAETATINEGYTVEEATITKDGLVLNKKSQYNTETNKVDITLEAYTTGTVEKEQKVVPTDIVLLLDESTSMLKKESGKTRISMLKTAVKGFVNGIDFSEGHKVSVVAFNNFFGRYNNKYPPFTEVHCVLTSNKSTIISGIDALSPRSDTDTGGSTYINCGLSLITGTDERGSGSDNASINGIFENLTDDGRNKVVIIFTDGHPGKNVRWGEGFNDWYGNSDYDSEETADAAIKLAKELKDKGVKIYTVAGFVPKLNPNNAPGVQSDRYNGSSEKYSSETNANAYNAANTYMHYMSSNYPNAYSIFDDKCSTNKSGGNKDAGYYLTASDASSLNSIFNSFVDETKIVPKYSLDDKTIITDELSQYFENADNVKVYKEVCTGGTIDNPTWGSQTEITSEVAISNEANSVSVSGFDFDSNCVAPDSTDKKGSKLVIEFSADPIEGFVGGNKVQTNNLATSGIKVGDELIATFPLPAVDIPMKYSFKTNDKSIYVTDEVALSDIVDLKALSGLINDFVNVEIVITDEDGNVVGKATNTHDGDEIVWDEDLNSIRPTETTEYKVSCTISPRYEDTNSTNYSEQEFESTANVYVYIPKINQYNDAVDKGTEVDLDTYVSVVDWECDEECAKPTGAAPNFTFEYDKVRPATAAEVGDNKDNYQMDVTTRFNVVGMTANGMNIIDLIEGFNTTEQQENKQFTISVIEPETTTKEPETTTEAPTTTTTTKPTTTEAPTTTTTKPTTTKAPTTTTTKPTTTKAPTTTTTKPTTTEAPTTTTTTKPTTTKAPTTTTTKPTTTEPETTTTIIIEDETPLVTAPTTTKPETTKPTTTAPAIIIEDETPLATVPSTTKPNKENPVKENPTPSVIIIEDETPLGAVPHTGDISEPMKWATLMAVAPVALTFIRKKREESEDETN